MKGWGGVSNSQKKVLSIILERPEKTILELLGFFTQQKLPLLYVYYYIIYWLLLLILYLPCWLWWINCSVSLSVCLSVCDSIHCSAHFTTKSVDKDIITGNPASCKYTTHF